MRESGCNNWCEGVVLHDALHAQQKEALSDVKSQGSNMVSHHNGKAVAKSLRASPGPAAS